MPTKTKKDTKPKLKTPKSVLARENDGTIQLTLSIPFDIVQKIREQVIKQLVVDLTVPGFRKGKAPSDIALKHMDKQKVYEATLQNVLPEYYSIAVEEHKLNPVLAPRFELISVEEDKDWTVRALTCEIPEIFLGDYKKAIKDAQTSGSIWVPGQEGDKQQATSNTREEKEQKIIKVVLDSAEVEVPHPLIDEEINHRLSQLLDQVQRLGLSVEQYLASTGRNADQLRQEYEAQARDSIKLVLVLNKVAELENIKVDEKEVETVMESAENALTKEEKDNPRKEAYLAEQKRVISSVLLRRKALEHLTSLV